MRIAHIQFVLGFEKDDRILLSNGHCIARTEKAVNGIFHQTNVPEAAPPEAPRAIIRTKDLLVNIGLNRFEIITTAPSHIVDDIDESLSYSEAKIMPTIQSLMSENVLYQWCGLVLRLEYPKAGKQPGVRHCEPVFDRLLNISRNNLPLSSFQLQFGIAQANRNVTFTISGYETRTFALPSPVSLPPGQMVNLNLSLDQSSLDESGLMVVYDINNRMPGSSATNEIDDFQSIIRETRERIKTLPENLNLEGILS